MKFLFPIFALCALLSSCQALAGSQAGTEAKFAPETITAFAKNVEKYAAAQGAGAFIIGRIGRPQQELPKGIRFTHTAIAVYSAITLKDGSTVNGYAIHNLYQETGKPDVSALVVDYPVDFFWGVHELSAGIIIPTPELQQRIIAAISSGKNKAVHNPAYSVIASPYNNELQNCTEHTLNIINASIYQTTDMRQLKANARAHFKGQRVRSSRFKLMLGSLFMDDVTTRDHDGKVVTTTFSTIGRYLQQNGLVKHMAVFNRDGSSGELL
ncbi:DUF2145 domain-containing protein [Thalassomonas viridans]|uniref:DUF2145 domain-containing protein n=1 Tax=Thalassomonas viridans TaxID=137584 RepID=A0AAE9Z4J0_9GAMM|nr:DUF2145 domain-containing protein [Thalassomonas viridans]WDE05123.1 DUF2145 domain-containing protein [Thalassomonas viridans]